MKIASFTREHRLLQFLLVFVIVMVSNLDAIASSINCELDFTKPTIEFPQFSGLESGDTMFLVCSSDLLGSFESQADVSDNCDPNPLISFTEYCQVEEDCSKGYKYFANYEWIVVDNNNNVCNFEINVAIGDKTAPSLELNWGEGLSSGDTIRMECGYGESFDESYVTAYDGCDPSIFCDTDEPHVEVFFRERIIDEGNCSDYLTKMLCTWIARDGCGNESEFSLLVYLEDTTAPKFIDVPDHFCGTQSLTPAEFLNYKADLGNIEVEDRCSKVELIYTIDDFSGGCGYFIQWMASDDCGNVSYHEQNVCIKSDGCNGAVSGTVQLDTDEDLTGDEPIESVQLLLIEDVDGDGKVTGGEQVFMSTTTDANGFYSFDNVPQGCYVIVEIQPSGVIDARDEDVTNPGNLDVDGTNNPVDNIIPVCITAGEFDDGNNFVEQQVILAIELSSFTAKYIDKKDVVNLSWQTEYEFNSNHFRLERSLDGINFSEIGRVHTSGNKSYGDHYQFEDAELTVAQAHYYRLVEVDADGAYHKYDIVSVKTPKAINAFVVFPNPSSDVFNVVFNSGETDELIIAELFSITGELILRQQTLGSTFEIDLSNSENGTYLLRLNSGSKSYIKKLVVAHI